MKPLFTEEVLQNRIQELGRRISADYASKDLVLVGILNGSFIFLADLCRAISLPHTIEFLGTSSYGDKMESSGKVIFTKDLQVDIFGKSIVIVEDIVDSGLTLDIIYDHLQKKHPTEIEICSLFWKTEKNQHLVKYCGFEVGEEFLVGFGLDFAGKFRHLPYVAIFDGSSD